MAKAPKNVKMKGGISFAGATVKWTVTRDDSISTVTHESPNASPTSAESVESGKPLKLGATAGTVKQKVETSQMSSGPSVCTLERMPLAEKINRMMGVPGMKNYLHTG